MKKSRGRAFDDVLSIASWENSCCLKRVGMALLGRTSMVGSVFSFGVGGGGQQCRRRRVSGETKFVVFDHPRYKTNLSILLCTFPLFA